jgi:Ricin-type beta-trefoil lectin domain/Putative Ig domain
MHRIRGSLAASSAVLAIAGGMLALAGTADAATTLSVTLSASGTGASAVWNSAGDPVLTVGVPSTTTFARMAVNSPPAAAPSGAPSFTTSNYASGSPPSNAGLGASNWAVIPASSGPCSTETSPPGTYIAQLAFIQNAGCGGDVTGAGIIADGGQAAGTSDTITDVSYDGETLAAGADVVTVTDPGTQTSTVGTAITALDMSASSSKGDAIASWSATGLPAGLSIDTTTGAITGTPTTAGSYAPTVTATDNGGTSGTTTFAWNVTGGSTPPTVTYTGPLKLVKMGLCLDDRNNSSTAGAVVQVWKCNGLSNQVWQVMSDGTIRHNNLCLDAKGRGTGNGTKIDLWTCNSGTNQQWDIRGWRIHYDNPAASGKVLDDTAYGGSGTQQELWTNNGGSNQVWASV